MQDQGNTQIDLQLIQALMKSKATRGGYSLRRRRTWFAEEGSTASTETPSTPPASTDQPSTVDTSAETLNADKPTPMIPKTRLDEEIGKRREAQTELDKLRKQLDDQAKAEETRQRQEEEQRGEFKSLYEKEKEQRVASDSNLADLQRQIEELTAYRQSFEDGLKAQLETLPPHIVALLEGKTPLEKATYLKEHGDSLTTRRAPNLDAGERNTGSGRRPSALNPIGGF